MFVHSNIYKGRRLSNKRKFRVARPVLSLAVISLLVACSNPDDILAAARFGDLKQLSACIESGIDVNHADPAGETALFHAIGLGKVAPFNLLLENGADAKVKDVQGNTPLHKAAAFGRAEFSEKLISVGAEINATNKVGSTPLHYAIRSGDPETVRRLVGAGSNVESPDATGETPMALAKKLADEGEQLDSSGRPVSGEISRKIVDILTNGEGSK